MKPLKGLKHLSRRYLRNTFLKIALLSCRSKYLLYFVILASHPKQQEKSQCGHCPVQRKNTRPRSVNFFSLNSKQVFGPAISIRLRCASLRVLPLLQLLVLHHLIGILMQLVLCHRTLLMRVLMISFLSITLQVTHFTVLLLSTSYCKGIPLFLAMSS